MDKDLTDADRQYISALAQIAAGLAGGLAGGSSSDAAQGAIVGKNAVENNRLLVQKAIKRLNQLSQDYQEEYLKY